MTSFPVEDDPFDEAECTKGFVLTALNDWVSKRNSANVPPDLKAQAANAFFFWFIARDYVVDGLTHVTPEGKPYLIRHRLAWLNPGVRVSPVEIVAPKLAVEMAYDDFLANSDIVRDEIRAKDDAAKRANPERSRR